MKVFIALCLLLVFSDYVTSDEQTNNALSETHVFVINKVVKLHREVCYDYQL